MRSAVRAMLGGVLAAAVLLVLPSVALADYTVTAPVGVWQVSVQSSLSADWAVLLSNLDAVSVSTPRLYGPSLTNCRAYKNGSNYYVSRSAWRVDWSSIPSAATITDVRLVGTKVAVYAGQAVNWWETSLPSTPTVLASGDRWRKVASLSQDTTGSYSVDLTAWGVSRPSGWLALASNLDTATAPVVTLGQLPAADMVMVTYSLPGVTNVSITPTVSLAGTLPVSVSDVGGVDADSLRAALALIALVGGWAVGRFAYR